MLFVNDIAKIVHGITSEYLGIPNMNVGDAFLIVWKIPKHSLNKNLKINDKNRFAVNSLADCSLLAIIKIIVKINSEECIMKYRDDKQIVKLNNNQ